MAEAHHVFHGLLDLDLGITSNNAEASAGGVEKNAIKFLEHLRKLTTIVTHGNGIANAETVQVSVK
jgi:hypothetical protein